MKNKIYHKWLLFLIATAGILTTIMVYSPGLKAGFYFDDEQNIVEPANLYWSNLSFDNLKILYKSILPEYEKLQIHSRIISRLSFVLNYMHGGLNPRGYHWVNLLIHLAVGFALFWVAILMALEGASASSSYTRIFFAAAIMSIIFLLHPLNIQAVTYIVQRMASLSTFFLLLSFGLYLKMRRSTSKRRRVYHIILIVIFWLLAIGSKEIAIIFPLVIILYELCYQRAYWRQMFHGKILSKDFLKFALPLFILLVVGAYFLFEHYYKVGAIRWDSLLPGRDYTGYQRLLTMFRVQLLYLGLLFWPAPSRLNLDFDFAFSKTLFDPITTFLSLLIWLSVISAAIFVARKKPEYGFPLLLYLLLHLIESLPLNLELVYEHRMYMPMIAMVFLGTNILAGMKHSKLLVAYIAIGILTVPLSYITYTRNGIWQNKISLWEDVVSKSPRKARPHYNLGLAMVENGRIDEAINQYYDALRLNPEYERAHYNLAIVLVDKGNLNEAIKHYSEVLRINPGNIKALNNLASTLAKKGRLEEAINHYSEAIRINPKNAELYYNRGNTLYRIRQYDQAIINYNKAIELNPQYADAYLNLGNTYAEKNLYEQAIINFNKAIELKPMDAAPYYNRGNAYLSKAQYERAITDYNKAIELNPMLAPAYERRAVVYYYQKEYEKSWSNVRKAQRLGYRVPQKFIKALWQAWGKERQ